MQTCVGPGFESFSAGVVAIQTVARGDPDIAATILPDIVNHLIADGSCLLPGIGKVMPEIVAVVAVQSVGGANPQVALPVAQNTSDVVAAQAVLFGEMRKIAEVLRPGRKREKQQKK